MDTMVVQFAPGTWVVDESDPAALEVMLVRKHLGQSVGKIKPQGVRVITNNEEELRSPLRSAAPWECGERSRFLEGSCQ